jgi:thymidine phosphorylase
MIEETLRSSGTQSEAAATLRVRRIGVHTHDEAVVFMRSDCDVCKSEGLSPRSQVLLKLGDREVTATLYHVTSALLQIDEAGLSEAAWSRLRAKDGDVVVARHPLPVASLASVRSRIFGRRLDQPALSAIIGDITSGRYSEIHLAAFITACSALPLDLDETTALTRAMVEVGDRLAWPTASIFDKHSVGGLPGNRTTPIVVAIVAANGLTIPKTSSRAITSPAGTADTMETLAPVDLDLKAIRRVVEQERGCLVWGGAVRLSPADDILIRIERALDLDPEGQLVASVLSKKIAAGSTHLVIDMPVGPTAKVRSGKAAESLARRLEEVGAAFGLAVRVLIGDGLQPIGRGIGPALEARDVLAVLQGSEDAPLDLRERACTLAGTLLEIGGIASKGMGQALACGSLDDGRAWAKFQRICEAQGGMRRPPAASHTRPYVATRSGRVVAVDNRRIAQLAKLAGAPDSKAAGVLMHKRIGEPVEMGEPLCTVHAQTRGELDYAFEYALASGDIFQIGEES